MSDALASAPHGICAALGICDFQFFLFYELLVSGY
jgi:hypothetical protein